PSGRGRSQAGRAGRRVPAAQRLPGDRGAPRRRGGGRAGPPRSRPGRARPHAARQGRLHRLPRGAVGLRRPDFDADRPRRRRRRDPRARDRRRRLPAQAGAPARAAGAHPLAPPAGGRLLRRRAPPHRARRAGDQRRRPDGRARRRGDRADRRRVRSAVGAGARRRHPGEPRRPVARLPRDPVRRPGPHHRPAHRQPARQARRHPAAAHPDQVDPRRRLPARRRPWSAVSLYARAALGVIAAFLLTYIALALIKAFYVDPWRREIYHELERPALEAAARELGAAGDEERVLGDLRARFGRPMAIERLGRDERSGWFVRGGDLFGFAAIDDQRDLVSGPLPAIDPGQWIPSAVALGLPLVLAGVVSFLVVGPLIRRLRALARVAEELAAGDLAARAPEAAGRDAIATLARRFNQTAAELERILESKRELLRAVSHEFRTPTARMRF